MGFIASGSHNSRSWTGIRHGWIKGCHQDSATPISAACFLPCASPFRQAPTNKVHFRPTPRPHSVGNSLFLSDGPAGGKYSTSTPAVCSLRGLTEELSPPQGLRDRGEPRKSWWTHSGQGLPLLLGPAWRSTAGGNGLWVGRPPVAALAGEHGGYPCGWIRWDGDCWGAQFCVASGGWACVHSGQMLGRGTAPLKSRPVWNWQWLLEGQRKGMSAGSPVALWPPAIPWDSPGEPPAAPGETSALWSASASFHRPEVNARGVL